MMAQTWLDFPFDDEVFSYRWQTFEDPVRLAMINSGALVNDAYIASLIANGSDYWTIPYNPGALTGDPVNYDGKTDITYSEVKGAQLSGTVWGRAKAWAARDFIRDFNSGADPMGAIVARVAKYWQVYDQNTLLKILEGIFGKAADDDTELAKHVLDITSKDETVGDDNKLSDATLGDLMQMALGDAKDKFTMAVMHSRVAQNLANKQLLEYWKSVDANGLQKPLNIGSINGLTVIIDDNVPMKDSEVATGSKEYTTFLFGNGAISTATAPVDHPVSRFRDELKYGGMDVLVTRRRLTMHPAGFSYKKPLATVASPSLEDLATKENWTRVDDAKNIPIAKVVSNG